MQKEIEFDCICIRSVLALVSVFGVSALLVSWTVIVGYGPLAFWNLVAFDMQAIIAAKIAIV